MKTADYGIDKPERVRALGMVGLVLVGTGLAQFIALQGSVAVWPELVMSICLWLGILALVAAGVMLWSSKSGKYGLAWRMLEEMKWRGREKVLDVGCGRGLLTIMAARKAPLGEVVGMDVWSQEELSENSIEAAMENAVAERVADIVRFEDGDVTNLRYGPNSFDKIVSSFCLHAIGKRSERNLALARLIKLLRPGGEIAILDILHTREYKKVFEEQGLRNIRRSPMKFLYCLPTRYLIAEK
jgi:SAM-dependent methyltransferase